ncbi:hypothetical protein ZYGR_0AK01150 [Zygosaccharomyces rouxii]|uniref:25S rRNA (uridine-N(3))-methyltransferase BMT5-like domain-containing protein n=1 Tax=Zygosaccharomyces rouxii TaxID=4956 RepID=A0A1Q3ADN4_ZYGRO|nr:hypothetical protein ZYGR_0AK01150 [Zygosaccharomyces rouxii]
MGKNAKGKGLRTTLQRHQNASKLRNIRKQKDKKTQKNQSVKKNQESQKNHHTPFIPFGPHETLLLVGEGDFSFARSIIEQNYVMPENLVVTSYDNSIEELNSKYPHSFDENYKFLASEGVPVFFGVDATDLVKSFKLSKKTTWTKILGESWNGKCLENIMFNFPHTGKGVRDQERNIRDHQNLVLGFFKSCKELFQIINSKWLKNRLQYGDTESSQLSEEGWGRIVLTLFAGEPYDSWRIKTLAKENKFQLQRSNRFEWEIFPGYHHKRTNSEQDTTKPAEERDARIYLFEKLGTVQKPSKRSRDSDDDDDDDDDN